MILFASLLKPTNDVRMYEKLAKGILKNNTFLGENKIKIHIVGFKPKKILKNTEYINFYPIFNFHRLSIKRFFAQFVFFKLLLEIRPKIVVACTFELLFFSVIYKIIFGAKLIYDVQENYAANIFYTKVFPTWLRVPLGYIVRGLESFCSFWVDEFWLAEKCYLDELHLYKKKYFFLENKVVYTQISPFLENINCQKEIHKNTKLRFLISGTLGEDYGTYQAIDWFKNYQKLYTDATLNIIGFCAKTKDFEKIQNNLLGNDGIKLIGGNFLVDSNLILEYASFTDFWVMPYIQNKNIENRIPTKFYEAIALQKTIILPEYMRKNQTWQNFFQENNYLENVIFLDFFEKKMPYLIKKIAKPWSMPITNPIFWETELKNLQRSLIFKN